MRSSLVLNPETLATWRSNYRSKLTLLLIVWLISPGTRLESTDGQSPRHTTHARQDSIQTATSTPGANTGYDVSRAGTPMARSPSLNHVPLTPPFPSSHSKTESMASTLDRVVSPRHPSKPSTAGHGSPIAPLPSIPLSPAPANSAVDLSACPIDFRGRSICPGEPPPRHPSFTERKSELADACQAFALWLLASLRPHDVIQHCGSFGVMALVFHMLLFTQLAFLVIEDQVVRTKMSNPMPPVFATSLKKGPAKMTTDWTKRWAHARWQFNALARRHWPALLSLAILTAGLGWLGYETIARGALSDEQLPDWGSWDDVPLGRWILDDVTGGERVTRRKRGGPLRVLVLLEISTALTSFTQPLKHLLPRSVLPPTLSAPQWLFPSECDQGTIQRHSGTILGRPLPKLSTPHLLQHTHDVILSALALLQLGLVVAVLPSYSPFTLPPHLIFHATRHHIARAVAARDAVVRTRDRLAFVFSQFPPLKEQNHSSTRAAQDTVPGGGRGTVVISPDDSWVCTICFEGESSVSSSSADLSSPDAAVGNGFACEDTMGLCQLPCGHRYHGECLTTWLHHQSFCPICHRGVVSDLAVPTAETAEVPSPQLREAADNMSDAYPGAEARRRRNARLQAQVSLPTVSTSAT